MAQTKQQIQTLLAGQLPRRELGQNFMIDGNLVRIVADAGELGRGGDRVIEVGPGTGTLTDELLARGAEVVAVEIDRRLAELLRNRLGSEPRFRLIEGDALANKHRLNPELLKVISEAEGPVKLVANLPYNVASPLIVEMLLAGVELMAVTIQKEVGERLRAQVGDDMYGALSVMVQLLADVEILRTLPPQAFWPAPSIESALVRLRRRDRLGEKARPFSLFLQKLFSARRKMMRKTLGEIITNPKMVLKAAEIEGEARPEELSAEKLLGLFNMIGQIEARLSKEFAQRLNEDASK